MIIIACILGLLTFWIDFFLIGSWGIMLSFPATIGMMALLKAHNHTKAMFGVAVIAGFLTDMHTVILPFGFFITMHLAISYALTLFHDTVRPVRDNSWLSLGMALVTVAYAFIASVAARLFSHGAVGGLQPAVIFKQLTLIIVTSFTLVQLMRFIHSATRATMRKWFFVSR